MSPHPDPLPKGEGVHPRARPPFPLGEAARSAGEGAIELSVIIPTFNERDSIAPLLAELGPALSGIEWEAVFVDDSTDETPDVISAHGAADRRVRLLRRFENRGGLAGAVVAGLAHARGTYVCVMDADLQHPPTRVRDLLWAARSSNADVVVASRYVPGGNSGGLDGPMRQLYSRGLKRLALSLFPRRLAGISDPLGGYFLLRRSVVQAASLRPIGYKILLEILIRCQWRTASEVAYAFQPRVHGASKADLRQGLRFLRHLAQLLWDCSPALAVPRVVSRAFLSATWKLALSRPSFRPTTRRRALNPRSASWPAFCAPWSATTTRSS